MKPDFFGDERVTAISRDARYTMVGLITLADDRGRLRDRPLEIAGALFPEEGVSMAQLRKWLAEIVKVGLILRYEVASHAYLWLPQFLRHQVIGKPTESELPPHPDDVWAKIPILQALKEAKGRKAPGEVEDTSSSSPVVLREESVPTRGSVPFPSVPIHEGLQRLTRERVAEALAILTTRWKDANETEVENAAAMYPTVDLAQGCRLAVTWASSPTWETSSAGSTLRSALRKLDAEKPKQTTRSRRGAALKTLMASTEPAA